MPTSASFRTRKPVRGYTLLEMLVVVAVLALATSLVAPAGYRMTQSWRESTRVDQVMQAMSALPLRARDLGRDLQIPDPRDPVQRPPFELPEGWRIEMSTPLLVRANGACSEAAGTLFTEHQMLGFRVEAPFCRVRRLAADES
ncbi:prepilin-type N-terminal cleavage/methylation domain-containing protein [Luteimonas deserti]|uniref:Prepilin-type N-terminal cleavage/methylation domain-containing protein n=1 Tax=Luteimonas deserti TaxID=2752306 RepID=A0A7Z0QQC4_9GAMM|nr:prepilin-type N-terminal cleavage/methylation domain-containing protein [Luteimonas deserti]NYZ62249.1 prepilin-type N-terminal cleavage/methylation domain-containing protein [Luteimonas deserti]